MRMIKIKIFLTERSDENIPDKNKKYYLLSTNKWGAIT